MYNIKTYNANSPFRLIGTPTRQFVNEEQKNLPIKINFYFSPLNLETKAMNISNLTYILFLFPFWLFGQTENYKISAAKAIEKISLDGRLNESAWQKAQTVKNFYMNTPYDTSFAHLDTEVKVCFDESNFYVGFKCYQKQNTYRVSSLKRDFGGGSSDVFLINIDTYKDKLNGFHFAISPYGVQREALVDNGENLSFEWDNKWTCKVSNSPDYWEGEVQIPFNTLRYKSSETKDSWRINFGRNVLEINETSNWVPVPRNLSGNNLAFSGLLEFEEKLPKPKTNISLIPYIRGSFSNDFPRKEEDLSALQAVKDNNFGVGMDAKVAVTPSLNLDLTFNPDFSQVDVDEQVANLSRFELFFPEKRQFFLENNDLFEKWGFPGTRPFFSRRIGLEYDNFKGIYTPVPILAGARLSGKITPKLRIGALTMQTKEKKLANNLSLPSSNFSVLTLQHKVFERSVLGGFFVNKHNFLNANSVTDIPKNSSSTGAEFNYYSPDGKWEAETYTHHSFNGKEYGNTLGQFVGYFNQWMNLGLAYNHVSPFYNSEAGFIPRKGIREIFSFAEFSYFLKGKKITKTITSIGVGQEGSQVFNWNGKLIDNSIEGRAFIRLRDNGYGQIGLNYNYTFLFYPFDPTNAYLNVDPDKKKNIVELPIGDYHYTNFNVGFTSGLRNNLFYEAYYTFGDYFNGKLNQLEGFVAYRFQPYGNIRFRFGHYDFKFPLPYNTTSYWLLGPQAELSFSKSLFFSTYLQFNTQSNNININSRLQWRFKPVSDLFIVYTSNYFATPIPNYNIDAFNIKNRALVLKLTYWLNL